MNTGSKRGPTLRRHKRSGNGYARFNGRQIWFGRFDDPAHAEFAAFKANWEADGRRLPVEQRGQSRRVRDLVATYLEHAEVYYRHPDETPTHEITNIRCTVRPLLELNGQLAVEEFGLRHLKLLRERLISAGLARKTINDRVGRIVRIFGWGTEEEVFGCLRALKRHVPLTPDQYH